jgi:hypothetical protein
MHQACHPIVFGGRIDWRKIQAICRSKTKSTTVIGLRSRLAFQISSLENTIHSIQPFNPEGRVAPGPHRDVRQCFKNVRKTCSQCALMMRFLPELHGTENAFIPDNTKVFAIRNPK